MEVLKESVQLSLQQLLTIKAMCEDAESKEDAIVEKSHVRSISDTIEDAIDNFYYSHKEYRPERASKGAFKPMMLVENGSGKWEKAPLSIEGGARYYGAVVA